ncbi:MAG: hypothetical protein NXI04_16640 [Planctomycetaceae bacterium]|nr:hypothetical protein [Planctomycetaceae bacterium]
MRKSIIIAVALVALVAAFLAWHRSSIVFEHQLSERYRLTIRQVPSDSAGKLSLQVTYHNPPAIGSYIMAKQTVRRPAFQLSFTSVTDSVTGDICVFDNNSIGFLLMYNPVTEDLWDSTGRSGGWNGSDSKQWQSLLTQLRDRNPSIPYRELPVGV